MDPSDRDDDPTTFIPGSDRSGVRPAPFLGDDGDAVRPSANVGAGDRSESTSERPLAYSAAKTADDSTANELDYYDPAQEDSVPPRPRRSVEDRPRTRGRNAPKGTNRMAIWAMVLSFIGITSPIGLFLGYRARSEISQTREYGEPFARVAIWIGWFYIAVFILALILYFWIAGQGN